VTTKERIEQLLVAQAEEKYMAGDTDSLNSLADRLTTAAVREDRLDRVRVFATLLMVAALFTIVVVIVNKKSPSTTLYQFVSLASGLAGIGLGWLFGTATTRGKKPRGG
jgi:uncharacterized membrane protein